MTTTTSQISGIISGFDWAYMMKPQRDRTSPDRPVLRKSPDSIKQAAWQSFNIKLARIEKLCFRAQGSGSFQHFSSTMASNNSPGAAAHCIPLPLPQLLRRLV